MAWQNRYCGYVRPNPLEVKTCKNKMRWQPSGNGALDIGYRWQTRRKRLEILCVVQIHVAIIYELCGAGKEEYVWIHRRIFRYG